MKTYSLQENGCNEIHHYCRQASPTLTEEGTKYLLEKLPLTNPRTL